MKTFTFHIDRKYTEWDRAHYEIEAETEEEAKKIAIAVAKEPREMLLEPTYYTSLDSALEDMTPAENGGEATVELYFDDILLTTNSTKQSILHYDRAKQ